MIGNKFKVVLGVILDFKLRAKDMRIVVISDRYINGSLIETTVLTNHRYSNGDLALY